MTRLNDKFNFFVPAKFEKSGENGEMKISGVCSSSVEDSDGETLEPSGFDFQPLLEKGYYNWNHQASKDPGAILGRPVKASIINQGKDFYTEGFLYKGLPQAKDLYQLAKTLEKEDPERRLGFSIEGQAIQRDPINPKRITKARITGIAITHCPKNPNTLLSIMKGEYSEPFVEVESLENELGSGDIEKGGKGSGRKPVKGDQLYYNKTQGGVKQNIQGTYIQTTEDGEYYHLKNAAGNIDFVHKKDITHHDSGDGKKPFKKSMDTGNVPAPESVEGKPKDQVDKDKIIEKSDIYLEIFSRYTQDVEKSEEVYSFIQQVSQKLFNMTEITPEVLEKAFQLLDSSIEKSKKSDLNGEEKKPEDYDKKDELLKNDEETTTTTTLKEEEDDDEVEKACSMLAKEKLEKGSSRGQAIDDLVEKGYSLEMSQGCVDRCIQEMNAKKDGGDITSASTLKKSEVVDVLQKSLEQIGLNIDEKFSALGQILKSQVEQNDLLKSEVANLQKSNTDLTTQLQKLSSTPFPTKSVRDVRAVERFEKSSDGKQVLSLSDSVQRKTLVDTLFGQVQIMKSQNRDYGQIEKAIMDIEISKSVDQQSQLLISQLGYTVVQ